MSSQAPDTKRKTITDIVRLKGQLPIVSLTAYTAPVARLADGHCDFILVGDSLGMVLYGMESTVPVSLDMMVNHGRAVVGASEKALVVIDMPFGSYQESPEQAFRNAADIMKRTGAGAVKLEGGVEMAETAAFLVERGVPVLGHIGLKPQSVHTEGGYRVTGRSEAEGLRIMGDAKAMENAGVFAIVLECMDPGLAGEITGVISVPTIGIGASSACDGQILVVDDMLGLSGEKVPKFVKKYADLQGDIDRAMTSYAEDVRNGQFPADEHTYKGVKPSNDAGKGKSAQR